MIPDHTKKAEQLADHYATILTLYRELEQLSRRVFEAFEGDIQVDALREVLRSKIEVVERIKAESQAIAALKDELTLSASERETLRHAESKLTELVKQVVEQEDKSRILLEKQGIRITRR